ncbi:hypothetical protein HDU86_005851 [Geranomyces michiganensis]|nr:hypothetical protein HDU86_005851 [Geranomyces michiganensis]
MVVTFGPPVAEVALGAEDPPLLLVETRSTSTSHFMTTPQRPPHEAHPAAATSTIMAAQSLLDEHEHPRVEGLSDTAHARLSSGRHLWPGNLDEQDGDALAEKHAADPSNTDLEFSSLLQQYGSHQSVFGAPMSPIITPIKQRDVSDIRRSPRAIDSMAFTPINARLALGDQQLATPPTDGDSRAAAKPHTPQSASPTTAKALPLAAPVQGDLFAWLSPSSKSKAPVKLIICPVPDCGRGFKTK